jgi:hypothetical protein
VLRYEHRTLDNLFDQFEARKDAGLARRVCSCIISHSKVEEDFYNGLEPIAELHGQVDRSLREHRQLDELTLAISTLDTGETLNERMRELQDALNQHIREEERSVFPAVLKALSKHQLRDMNASLRAAKDKLLTGAQAAPASPHDKRRTP